VEKGRGDQLEFRDEGEKERKKEDMSIEKKSWVKRKCS